DPGADLGAAIEVGHVVVGEPDTAGGYIGADGPRLVGAVNAEKRVFVATPEIERAGADRILRAALHAQPAFQLHQVRPDLGLALQHLGGRIPARPLLLGVNGGAPGPDESFGTDADAIANGLAAALDQVEEVARWIDDDRARRLVGRVTDILTR